MISNGANRKKKIQNKKGFQFVLKNAHTSPRLMFASYHTISSVVNKNNL
jgi:hypothetical protein